MNQWFIQNAFMITNGIVVVAFIAGAAFLLLFWKYMGLLGDYDALVKKEQKRIERNYWSWVIYDRPKEKSQDSTAKTA